MLFIVVAAGCLSGFILFRKQSMPKAKVSEVKQQKLSVIIPARNEEKNLPYLLTSLKAQTYRPFEIIVVDDFSEDQTKSIAESFGVTVVESTPLPKGWTGKTWALWTGYKAAAGDIFAFLDADIRLEPDALASLLKTRENTGGVISVIPYHYTEKFYERFALITNFLGIFAFMSPFEKRNPKKGLYGACILATRKDYETISGHEHIKSEVLDDLNLGAKFREAGIKVSNYIGHGLVSFRMYPNGMRSEVQGFGKGAVLSTATLRFPTVLLIAIWVIGLLLSESALIFFMTPWAIPLAIGYLLYMFQLFYFIRYVGRFGIIMPILHILSACFFIFIMLYSAYQVVFLRRVTWKGRYIDVGGKKT